MRRSKSQPGANTGFPNGGPSGAVPCSPPAASPGPGDNLEGPGDNLEGPGKTPVAGEVPSSAESGLSKPQFTDPRTAQSRKSSP